MAADGGRLVGPRRTEAVMGLLAATLGSATVGFLAYGPLVGGGLLSATSAEDGVTRRVVRTLSDRHGLLGGGSPATPLVVAMCAPFLLIGVAAVVDAVRGSLVARVVLLSLTALVGLVTVVGIASIGLLLVPATLSAVAAVAASSARPRHAPQGPHQDSG